MFAQAVDRLGEAGWLDGPYDSYRQSGGEYSFFVPTDDAFASLLRAYNVTQDALFADEGALAAWVKAHVVREAPADGAEELNTYSGGTLAFNGTVLQGKGNEAGVMGLNGSRVEVKAREVGKDGRPRFRVQVLGAGAGAPILAKLENLKLDLAFEAELVGLQSSPATSTAALRAGPALSSNPVVDLQVAGCPHPGPGPGGGGRGGALHDGGAGRGAGGRAP